MCALMGTTYGAKTWCWGSNDAGQFGDWANSPALTVVPVDAPGARGAVAITGGYAHTCALMSSRTRPNAGLGRAGAAGQRKKTAAAPPPLT